MISRRNFLQAAGAMAAAPTLLLDNATAAQAAAIPDPYQQLVLFMRKLRELELLYGMRSTLTAEAEESFKQNLLNDDKIGMPKGYVPIFVKELYRTRRAMIDLYENALGTGHSSFLTLFTACGLLQFISISQKTDGTPAGPGNLFDVDPAIRRVVNDLLKDKFIKEIETTEGAFRYRTTKNGDTLYQLLREITWNPVDETDETNELYLSEEHLVPKITALLPKLTELDGLALLKQMQEELEKYKNRLPD